MTTKYKIISGFVLMVILISGIALWGYKDLGDASERFSTYRRYARINVYTSEMMVNLGAAGLQANAFMLSRDPKALEAGMAALDALDALFAKAIAESQVEENIQIMTGLRADAVKYKTGLENLGTALTNMNTQYIGTVAPNGLEMAKRFHQLAQSAKQSQNIQVLGLLEEAWGEYSLMLSALGRYNYSRRSEDSAAVDSRRDRLKPLLQSIGSMVITPEARVAFTDLEEAAAAMFKGIEEMERYAVAATERITALAAMRNQFSDNVLAFSTRIDAEMQEIGRETLAENENGQNQLLFASVGGVILGVLLAVFIIIGIVRVLTELSAFATAIAAGDFSRQIKIHEKGEIGGMVDAMRRIPEVLQSVISDVANGVVMLQGGHFRARLDPAAYAGSYGDLVTSVNTVAEAYTEVLDELPLPILAADTSLTVRFANAVGKEVVGGKLLESYITDGSARFGKTAMENKRNFSAEATIANNGKEMHFAVTTVPLLSKDTVVGFIEILSDLTEIWTQQRVMLQVAHEASEISNRVAAASEELAAQVEQVSRGAEVQRSRIESTASAMTEMNATVIEVAKSAGEASEQSEGTRSKAAQGAELVNKVVQSINQVNSVGQNLQTNMQELGKQAESIGNVMNVISDIADQTNLLALNAAIEAARAGEAGRGFAVVADEVRKLAEKTMEATQEVGTSISAVQQSARVNIGEVGKAVASVAEANELATSSGQALAEIVSLASANSAVVASIATAAEEQSATSEEISRAIDEINLIVGETTEGMVQSSSAVQDLSRMAQELRRVMEGLK